MSGGIPFIEIKDILPKHDLIPGEEMVLTVRCQYCLTEPKGEVVLVVQRDEDHPDSYLVLQAAQEVQEGQATIEFKERLVVPTDARLLQIYVLLAADGDTKTEMVDCRLCRINDSLVKTKEQRQEEAVLIQAIHGAFDGVSREDGVTWHQTFALDGCEGAEQEQKMRAKDTDKQWQDVSYDTIEKDAGVGGPSFLDAKGLRYYLPVLMTHFFNRYARHDHILYGALIYGVLMRDGDDDLKSFFNQRFSLLNDQQNRVVYQFLKHVVAYPDYYGVDHQYAQKAIDAYWGQFAG